MSEKLLKPAKEIQRGRNSNSKQRPDTCSLILGIHGRAAPWAMLSNSTVVLRSVLLLQPSSVEGIFSYSLE